MPDWYYNKLELIGTPEEVNQVLAFISSKDDKGNYILFDFRKIKPIPEELLNSSADISAWCESNWGTKCNASKTFIENNVIWFLTTGDPTPIMEKLSLLFPTVRFSLYGGDENAHYKYYNLIFKEGVNIYYEYEYDLEEAKKQNAGTITIKTDNLSIFKDFPSWFLSKFKNE